MGRLAVGEFAPVSSRQNTDAAARPKGGTIAVWLLLAAIFAILLFGWVYRSNDIIAPQKGLGYALGIAGGTMMLMVLLYPLRKRVRFMRNWARLAPWFRWHMVLGCLGPVLVVVHSNFQTQSLNGLMALVSTLIVAGSGVVGRYLYVRIHRGLYGAKVEARELLNDAASLRPALAMQGASGSGGWEDQLKALENQALAASPSLYAAMRNALRLSVGTRRTESAILRADLRSARIASLGVQRHAVVLTHAELRTRLARYFRALRRAGSLAVYERLFALWHVLHLPLIVLLVFTAIIHVIAVHLY